MNRIAMLAVLLAMFTTSVRVEAQSPAPSPVPVPTLGQAQRPGKGAGQRQMRGGGAMAMLLQNADQVTVENTAAGATITFSAKDPAAVARIQKIAESMRLMHEATKK
jgi:hypothetical protein